MRAEVQAPVDIYGCERLTGKGRFPQKVQTSSHIAIKCISIITNIYIYLSGRILSKGADEFFYFWI
jgi:hypothetical protein